MKKIVLICLAMVLALGLLGVGYARWQDELFLQGEVGTGNIGLAWSQGIPSAPDDVKGVSQYYCAIVGDTLYIYISNAYPCVTYIFPIDVHGTGSVPVHIGPWTNVTSNLPGGTLTLPDWCSNQVHEGGQVDGEVTVHLDNTAEQNATYTFSATLTYAQYNEPLDCPQ
ncbi:MAG: hypothetical protein ABIH70_06265 [Chloroflexota bacterium]